MRCRPVAARHRAQGRQPTGCGRPLAPTMRTPWPWSGERVYGPYVRAADDRSADRSVVGLRCG